MYMFQTFHVWNCSISKPELDHKKRCPSKWEGFAFLHLSQKDFAAKKANPYFYF